MMIHIPFGRTSRGLRVVSEAQKPQANVSVVTRVIEKVIEKPVILQRECEILTPLERPVPSFSTDDHVPVVIGTSFAQPLLREEGQIEVPLRRYVPRLIPIDIPTFCSQDEQVLDDLAKRIQCRIVNEIIRPVDTDETPPINGSYFVPNETLLVNIRVGLATTGTRQQSCVQAGTVKSAADNEGKLKEPGSPQNIPQSSMTQRGLSHHVTSPHQLTFSLEANYTVATAEFTAADYNSWLLLLNQHLKGDVAEQFASHADHAEPDPGNFLLRQLPFMELPDKTRPFWDSLENLQGRLSISSRRT